MRILSIALASALCLAVPAGAATPANSETSRAETAAPAIAVEQRGAGPTVLFIPGLASGTGTFDDILRQSSVDARLITLAGFADVPPTEGPFFDTRLRALRDYLAQENLSDVVVVGHSLGGVMAMKLAIAEPRRVRSLLIIDSVPFLAQFMLGAADEESARKAAESLRTQILSTPAEAYEAQQKAFAAMQSKRPEAQARIARDSLASDRPTVVLAMAEMLGEDLRDDIAAISQPMTVLYPFRAGSPFTAEQTDAVYKMQYALAKTATLERIDDSGHFIADDQPDAVARALARAIAKN